MRSRSDSAIIRTLFTRLGCILLSMSSSDEIESKRKYIYYQEIQAFQRTLIHWCETTALTKFMSKSDVSKCSKGNAFMSYHKFETFLAGT